MIRKVFVMLVLLTAVSLAQTVRIQGKELDYRLVDGKQMVSAEQLSEAFPGFESDQEWVDLNQLCRDPNARVLRRNGLIVSVRYYSDAMARLYGPRRVKRTETESAEQAAETGDYRAIMNEIVRLSNIEREKHGAQSLEADPYLEKAATGHSKEMAELDFFSHTSPTAGRETPSQRIKLTGILPRATAENIASFTGHSESSLAQKAVTGWMNSPGHRRNLLDPTYTHIGIGVGRRGNTYYLTQNFCAY